MYAKMQYAKMQYVGATEALANTTSEIKFR